MCQHCWRLSQTPCPHIPLSCPLCPQHLLSENCPKTRQGYPRRKIRFSRTKKMNIPKTVRNKVCRGISDLYSTVVSEGPDRQVGGKLMGRDSNGLPVRLFKTNNNVNVEVPTRQNYIPVVYMESHGPSNYIWPVQSQRPDPSVNPYMLRKNAAVS